jgi:1-acyl-sn-glycerol-3-phosphate acyltransferase
MKPKTVRAIIRFVIRLIARVEAHGVEYLPSTGPCIIASNHLGRLDAALPYCYSDRDDLVLMVAEKYKKSALFRFLVKELDGIWVDRFNADLVAMRATLNRLKAGAAVIMAPEGTRSLTEALAEGKSGATYLAMKAGVPIIPVGMYGSEDRMVKTHLKRLQRVHIVARAGKPFTLPPFKGEDRDTALNRPPMRSCARSPPSFLRNIAACMPITLD